MSSQRVARRPSSRARRLLARGFAAGALVAGLASTPAFAQNSDPIPEAADGVPGNARCASAIWDDAIGGVVARRPAAEISDVYKLLYQATRGSEHAVTDPATARAWLSEEIAALGSGPPEAVVDTLPGGAFARVHLRPYLSEGRSAEALLEAFVETANDPAPAAGLACALESLVRAARDGRVPWAREEVEEYLAARAAEGHPAVHHSEAYERAYRPAYRVVSVSRLSALAAAGEASPGGRPAALTGR
jgi:hypothetical protein